LCVSAPDVYKQMTCIYNYMTSLYKVLHIQKHVYSLCNK